MPDFFSFYSALKGKVLEDWEDLDTEFGYIILKGNNGEYLLLIDKEIQNVYNYLTDYCDYMVFFKDEDEKYNVFKFATVRGDKKRGILEIIKDDIYHIIDLKEDD